MLICPDCSAPHDWHRGDACSKCGLVVERKDGFPVVLSRRDRASGLFDHYRQNYDEIAADDQSASIQDPEDLIAKAGLVARLAAPLANLSALDVGVGQGHLLREFVAAGAKDVAGIDIAPSYLDAASSIDADLVVANAENLPYREHFDLITCTDVLEHVLNPADVLVACHRALKDGGRLIVRVPWNENLISYSRLRGCQYDLVHLRSFTKGTLRTLVQSAGFAITLQRYTGYSRYSARRIFVGRRWRRVAPALYSRIALRRPYVYDEGVVVRFTAPLFLRPIELLMVATKAS